MDAGDVYFGSSGNDITVALERTGDTVNGGTSVAISDGAQAPERGDGITGPASALPEVTTRLESPAAARKAMTRLVQLMQDDPAAALAAHRGDGNPLATDLRA